jgi:starch synthase (maltosyl-transferring)
MNRPRRAFGPRIYYLHPLLAGLIADWPRHLDRCREMGFDHVGVAPLFVPGESGDIFLTADHERIHPALQATGSADETVAQLVAQFRQHGLGLVLDFVAGRSAAESALTKGKSAPFRFGGASERIDPRSEIQRSDSSRSGDRPARFLPCRAFRA